MKCFRNLTTLEYPCFQYKEVHGILNYKNNLEKLILFNNTFLINSVYALMNGLSKNYKKLKKLSYLGIKAIGNDVNVNRNGCSFKHFHKFQS